MSEEGKRNRALLLVLPVIVIAAAGLWYYFMVYTPQYEAERLRLVTLYTTADPIELDPALAYDTDSNRVIMNVFDRLVRYERGTTEVEPALAESWDILDPMTYVFHLRSDVSFHDGSHFDASCVKYTFDRIVELEGPTSYLFMVINSTEVLDEYTVKITLNYDFSPFLSVMAHPAASMVSESSVAAQGEAFSRHPVGTGAFKFESWSLGKELILVSNEDYYRGPPRLERIVFKSILEASARKAALETGEIDVVVGGGVLAVDLPGLEANPDLRVFESESTAVEYLGFNTFKEPLNDPNVREAIALAIDYENIVDEALGGRAERVGGPIPPSILGYKEFTLTQRDTAKASQLLAEAGYPQGFDISLTYNIESLERRKIAEAIRNSLADVGINVRIVGLDWESAIDSYLSMEHYLMLNGWEPDYFDPDSYLSPQFHTYSMAPYGANIFGFSDPEVDGLIEEGLNTTDMGQRAIIYQTVQDLIVEQRPCLFLVVPSEYDVIRFNVKNWVHMPPNLIEFYELYKQ